MQTHFDADWRERARAGDGEAVRAFVDAVLTPLYRFCFHRVGRDRHRCEEVVQETLLRAIRDLDRYDPQRAGGQVFPWLIGLARNEIQRILGRDKAMVSLEAMWARVDGELVALYERLEDEPLGADVLEREETRSLVNATMSQLPTHYREVLEAKYVAGTSVRDLAAASLLSEKAVESLLSRARKAFRTVFLTLSRQLEPSCESSS